jgi:hypothetical protein
MIYFDSQLWLLTTMLGVLSLVLAIVVAAAHALISPARAVLARRAGTAFLTPSRRVEVLGVGGIVPWAACCASSAWSIFAGSSRRDRVRDVCAVGPARERPQSVWHNLSWRPRCSPTWRRHSSPPSVRPSWRCVSCRPDGHADSAGLLPVHSCCLAFVS